MEKIRIRGGKKFGSETLVALAKVHIGWRIRMGTTDLDPGAMKLPLFYTDFDP
jgi:hypothetical protein